MIEPSVDGLSLRGWGTAQAGLSSIGAMRKSFPAWVPQDTPGHFLKYADEQTVLAVAAIDQAIRSSDLDAAALQNWTIIAAPRFIGRLAGTATLKRFSAGGGPAISPHVIPQHSLHSISGALSILLSSRQPNFGVGGTADSLEEGLLAALTFPAAKNGGVLLVATGWTPEPTIDEQGNCTNAPVCHAAALALQSSAGGQGSGRLRLMSRVGPHELGSAARWSNDAIGLSEALSALAAGRPESCFAWRLNWGATLILEARAQAAQWSRAA